MDLDVIETVNQRLAAASNGEYYASLYDTHLDPQQSTPGRRRGQSADSRRDIFKNYRSQASCDSNTAATTVRSEDAELLNATAPRWRQEFIRPLGHLPKSSSAVAGHFHHQHTGGVAPLATNDLDYDHGAVGDPALSTRPGSSLRSMKTFRYCPTFLSYASPVCASASAPMTDLVSPRPHRKLTDFSKRVTVA